MKSKDVLDRLVFFIVLVAVISPITKPKTVNSQSLYVPNLDQAEVPEFSANRGFYNSSFDVIVHSSTAVAAVIKYTFDGSDPRTSTTALLQNSPATIRIDPHSEEGQRGQTPGVVLRACSIAPDNSVSEVVTHTYLFSDEVAMLSPDGIKPGPNWPEPTNSANPQVMDYGLDADVVNDPRYTNLITAALTTIPSISVAADLKHLFSPDSGIYMNAQDKGEEWERPASIELIYPDGSQGFQINAGIRIRGGWSRHGDNPKHAFRFFFREEYGKGKLEFPLFGAEGVDEFDKIDLRTSQNYSWSYPGHLGEYNTMNRDVFSRDLQRETGQPFTRSRYYHLYLNGVYWGLFQSQERSEARYAASYFGGNKEDYDVIKVGDGGIEATDGNLNAYREIWEMTVSGFGNNTNYFKIQGLNPDGTLNPEYKVLVDADNLVDFMLVIFYTGNFDSPVTKFGQNRFPNNFYAVYNRSSNAGFRFFIHDAEHTLRTTGGEGPGIGLNENRVNIGSISGRNRMTVSDFSGFHPQWLHFRLSSNIEYRTKFADHVYKHFFNAGCMTPASAADLFLARAQEIALAIIGESARWGDVYHDPARTRDDDWQVAIDDIVNNYFPYRTGIVLNQLKEVNLYPSINPPIFKNNNEEIIAGSLKIAPGYQLQLVNPNTEGTILYTTDGQDPRQIGGGTASSVVDGGAAIEITVSATTLIKARVLSGATWSALHELILFGENSTSALKITEIHYHPLDGEEVSDDEYEFLELKNIAATPIDLSRASFKNGISYTFPDGTILEPYNFIVIASNREQFNNRYGFFPFGGEYSGQLDNGGESIVLCYANGDTLVAVNYRDQSPWPDSPDGGGVSLVCKEVNPTGNLNDAANWRASYQVHGSPGQDDLASTAVKTPATGLPSEIALYQNYPNPFNPETKIHYILKSSGKVRLTVYDLVGREVAKLVDGIQNAGLHTVIFSGTGIPGGLYLYRLQTADRELTKKMILLK